VRISVHKHNENVLLLSLITDSARSLHDHIHASTFVGVCPHDEKTNLFCSELKYEVCPESKDTSRVGR
jgi:hypothetical protein